MKATAILPASLPAFDPSNRQILPADIFTRAHWGVSATVREALDLDRVVPMVPPPAADVICESVILSGAEVFTSLRKGSAVISHKRTVAAFETPELSIVMEAPAGDDLQTAAGEALAALNQRRPARTIATPAPYPTNFAPLIALAFVVVALGVTAWAVL